MIYLILLFDFIAFITYSLTKSIILGKSIIIFMELFIYLIAIFYFFHYKLFKLKKFTPHLLFLSICYIYFLISLFYNTEISFDSLKSIRLISVPFNLMIIGHIYRIKGYSTNSILIKFIYFSLIVSIYSIIEITVLSNISIYNQIFNISL